jgi:hypothetical protein
VESWNKQKNRINLAAAICTWLRDASSAGYKNGDKQERREKKDMETEK